MNAYGHHHVGHIGILGVDKKGEEFYQVSLGGSASRDASRTTSSDQREARMTGGGSKLWRTREPGPAWVTSGDFLLATANFWPVVASDVMAAAIGRESIQLLSSAEGNFDTAASPFLSRLIYAAVPTAPPLGGGAKLRRLRGRDRLSSNADRGASFQKDFCHGR